VEGLAVHPDFASVGPIEPVKAGRQRRLAGAILAQQAMQFAGHHVERDVVVGEKRSETLRQVPDRQARYLAHLGSARLDITPRFSPISARPI
jgi:hypothetical protein